MTARSELEAIYARTVTAMDETPEQALNLLNGAEEYNLNKINAHNKFVRDSLLMLADKIDTL